MAPKTINKHDSSLVSGNVGDVRTSYTKIQIAIWIKAWVEIQISLLSHEIDLCKKSHLLYYTLPDKHTHFWDWIVPPTRLRFWTMEILCPPTSATTPKCEKKHRNLTAVARPTGAVTARAKLSWKCTHPFRTNSEGMQLAPKTTRELRFTVLDLMKVLEMTNQKLPNTWECKYSSYMHKWDKQTLLDFN